ncbi:MAG: SDR family oxidoreductase [Gammaproteobacteria bacterium]
MRLAGRRIIITGAASGIGKATAVTFRREGAAVALLDNQEALLGATLDELNSQDGPKLFGLPVDVTAPAALQDAMAQINDALGGIDGIVSSAGIDCLKPFALMSYEDWHNTLEVNLSGPFNLCLAALPFMQREPQGTIVHIASGAALRPLAGRTAYCASKAGLVMFAKNAGGGSGPLFYSRQCDLSGHYRHTVISPIP